MKEKIETLISKTAIQKRISEIAEDISQDYAGESLELICVLKGGVVFMVDLAKHIKVPVTMNFMDVSSYGNATSSSGEIKIYKAGQKVKHSTFGVGMILMVKGDVADIVFENIGKKSLNLKFAPLEII